MDRCRRTPGDPPGVFVPARTSRASGWAIHRAWRPPSLRVAECPACPGLPAGASATDVNNVAGPVQPRTGERRGQVRFAATVCRAPRTPTGTACRGTGWRSRTRLRSPRVLAMPWRGASSHGPGRPNLALSPLTTVAHLATVLLGCAPKQGSWTYFAALFKAPEIRTARGSASLARFAVFAVCLMHPHGLFLRRG